MTAAAALAAANQVSFPQNMSSTPLIELDWSSTPQHSYVQLGDPTPPENNSDDISYNTERPVIFSTKDILSLDIDDIYPYTHSTLHFEDNETEYIYDDEDYFQQLLQAHLNAEIEEGSVLRDDKPLIDNTPLTPIQEINPIPPLDTAPLLDNLPIVENINPIPLDTAPLLEILPMYKENKPIRENNKCCQQPAAVVLSHNRLNCNKHLPKFIIHGRFRTGILPQNPSFLAHNRYQTHNHAKEVHSTRLGISYNVITRRYNEWRGKQDFYLKNVMEPLSTKTKKGVNTTRTFYKEYYNFELDANRTQQQIKRWNRLKFSNFKAERSLGQVRPFLINEHSHVYKKIQHAVERFPPYSRKSKLEIESDKIIRKRTKNWKRPVRRYGKYQNRLRSPPPPIVEDKTIDTNTQPEATFFSDKLTLNSHKAHFARTTPTGHQYPSTPEPDPLKSIKDGDERPIRKPRKRRIILPPTPGHDQ
ncbi:uncharacterized protein OCT59_024727 [Rhizophagus irregularis]|uniref:uncharacterized protein n=1 Tax=Rhizophagus irregularis TaxID=588596 RepID=UPI003323A9E6|nr:hypothetical protein OCT59_024727 [Rhizophagus irregularis]